LAEDLRIRSQYFVLALVADTRELPGPGLVDAAQALIRCGASYVCLLGPDCERLHDCFDEADFYVNGESTTSRLLMTTWHDDESLEEMIWFAINTTVPSPDYFYRTQSVVIATIGSDDWATRAQRYVDDGAPMT